LCLLLPGCKPKQSNTAPQAPINRVTIFAPVLLEPIIRSAEAASRETDIQWRVNLRTGGAQSLAWTIEDGDIPDLYISSSVAMAENLIPQPTSIQPWLQNRLVVVTLASTPNPILKSDRALERSTGPVGVGLNGSLQGDYARLALRYSDIWELVDRRTTPRHSIDSLFDALRSGEVELAIVFATDAKAAGPEFVISQQLELPERVGIVYTKAAFSEMGAGFAEFLDLPEPLRKAVEAGYLPSNPPIPNQPLKDADADPE